MAQWARDVEDAQDGAHHSDTSQAAAAAGDTSLNDTVVTVVPSSSAQASPKSTVKRSMIPRSKVPVVAAPAPQFTLSAALMADVGMEAGWPQREEFGSLAPPSPAHSRASTYTLDDVANLASLLEDARNATAALQQA